MAADLVTPAARIAEKEIDAAYNTNPLVSTPFATAAWYTLGVAEDRVFVPEIGDRQLTFHQLSALLDNLKFMLRYALHWIWESQIAGGQIPPSPNEALYTAADELLQQAHAYTSFVSAYTYASRGYMTLDADPQSRRLIMGLDLQREGPYEAYDKIAGPARTLAILERWENTRQLDALILEIGRSLSVSSRGFDVNFNPGIVKAASEFLAHLIAHMFSLPEKWRFSRYSIGDFKAVYTSLAAIGMIHNLARKVAAGRGAEWLGFFNCLMVFGRTELINRLARYSGRGQGIVAEIVNDLTYAAQGQNKPDPALQPLVAAMSDTYLVSPMIITSTAAERNLLALLNRIPAERTIYLNLVDEKQALMRKRADDAVAGKGWRTWSGSILGRPDLPDIDLAIISDTEMLGLILEMKWFIDPAEVREVVEKSEEIARGVEQLRIIRGALNGGLEEFRRTQLGVGRDYRLNFAVVSANSIGVAGVQDKDFPVINEVHFLEKLIGSPKLSHVIDWLIERHFLPVENRDFEIVRKNVTVAGWTLEWYSLRVL